MYIPAYGMHCNIFKYIIIHFADHKSTLDDIQYSLTLVRYMFVFYYTFIVHIYTWRKKKNSGSATKTIFSGAMLLKV